MKTPSCFIIYSFILFLITGVLGEHHSNNVKPIALKSKPLTGKFLHITDIHLDPNYLVGSDPKKLCHRKSKKAHKNTAGKFGALNTECDSPLSLVNASFQFMKNSLQDIDFILYTGDTARHDRDKKLPRTGADVLEDHKAVIHLFIKTFDVNSIKLIPTIGNNDGIQHNDFTFNTSIYNSLQSIWEPLGLNLSETFHSGGYFIQDQVVPGLRVINTNSMFFFKKNHIVTDCNEASSPGAIELIWLKQALEQAKDDNVMVYVMGHVPPNDDDDSPLFMPTCLDQYYQILGEYGDIILGHFTGHTNNDVLTAVVPKGNSFGHVTAMANNNELSQIRANHVSTVLFNAPSIIPVNNPAIRVYRYETSKTKENPVGTILDWTQYYVDLDKANYEDSVQYEIEYQASKLYGVNRFDGQGISQAFKQLRVNKNSRRLYSQYVTVSSQSDSV
ncbi:Metallo-dependent phosphatase-like protein [Halteromyces radiatus]|uniref:Metallo-dependent phosphatase-like protein n=1 Tax=Halteromyces radiatus TaxID=101107 RepID=UPI002220E78C|nr:Metallo-dependent phosphatase-like protein [Halteromyces radiatus]KAI8090038.1 Metallo-dependent phosphatase-like protein [Halteromyces radiatus]